MSDKRIRELERHVERLTQQATTAEELLESTRRINWQVQDELEQRVRELEAAREAQARLMAVVSHELRTPMNGMLGASQLLMDQLEDPERLALAKAMHGSTRSLSRLVDQVLAHHDAVRDTGVAVESTDIRGLVHELRVLHVGQAELRGLRLGVSISPDLPVWVSADGGRVRQVLTNLLDNALKYCRDGQVDLDVDWADGQGRFQVRDTGPGIAEAERAVVFEPFQRGSRAAMGWGLGLAICRQVVNRLGGELGLQTRLGHGSTFSFTVPMPACEAPSRPRVSAGRLDGVRALVVDDNEVNRLIACKMLESLGATALEAPDAETALLALPGEYDVILLDLAMPGVDGYACATALRKQGILAPILALTAASLPGTRQACLDAGMNGYIRKPVLRDTLFTEVTRAFRDRSGQGPRSHPAR